MCGGAVGCKDTYGKNLKSVGEGIMSGEGKLANFTILSENPLSVNPQTIKDIEIKATIVEGQYYPIR